MSLRKTLLRTCLPVAAVLAATGCADRPTALASSPAAPAAAAAQQGVPLWKVSDADTTVYLFGTVHLLTPQTTWMDSRIETALAASDELITELPAKGMQDPATQQKMMAQGTLAQGTTLRSLLSDTQRATYEAALTRLGVPAQALDGFEPWLAGMTLAILPLMKEGFTATSGVEMTLESKAGADIKRGALETLDGQLALFDTLPLDQQIAFLTSSAAMTDKIVPSMAKMVEAWQQGDADRLAALINEAMTDPGLADRLLYGRNRNWAKWVEDRLDTPGTAFVAVGAGHLAGTNSVQDYLEKSGVTVTRIR